MSNLKSTLFKGASFSEVSEIFGLTILTLIIVIAIMLIPSAAKCKKHNPTIIPLSEVRCSDLERVIDECEAADDVALCRGRYDVKIAMCFRGQ